jgi:hypothetical protein
MEFTLSRFLASISFFLKRHTSRQERHAGSTNHNSGSRDVFIVHVLFHYSVKPKIIRIAGNLPKHLRLNVIFSTVRNAFQDELAYVRCDGADNETGLIFCLRKPETTAFGAVKYAEPISNKEVCHRIHSTEKE